MKTLKKTYTPELKEEAVKLVLTQGLSLEHAAVRLSISKGTLANRVVATRRAPAVAATPGGSIRGGAWGREAQLRKALEQQTPIQARQQWQGEGLEFFTKRVYNTAGLTT